MHSFTTINPDHSHSPRKSNPKLSDLWESHCVIRAPIYELSSKWYKTIQRAMLAGQTEAVLMKLPIGATRVCQRAFRPEKGGECIVIDPGLESQIEAFCKRQGIMWKVDLVVNECAINRAIQDHKIYCEFGYLVAHWKVPHDYKPQDPFEDSE